MIGIFGVFLLGFIFGGVYARGARRRWLLRNAWALKRNGNHVAAALVRELAEGNAVQCEHGLDAATCPRCAPERFRAWRET